MEDHDYVLNRRRARLAPRRKVKNLSMSDVACRRRILRFLKKAMTWCKQVYERKTVPCTDCYRFQTSGPRLMSNHRARCLRNRMYHAVALRGLKNALYFRFAITKPEIVMEVKFAGTVVDLLPSFMENAWWHCRFVRCFAAPFWRYDFSAPNVHNVMTVS